MVKGVREIIRLYSSAKTGHFYSTTKNRRKNLKRIELKKFDPVIQNRVMYVESK